LGNTTKVKIFKAATMLHTSILRRNFPSTLFIQLIKFDARWNIIPFRDDVNE